MATYQNDAEFLHLVQRLAYTKGLEETEKQRRMSDKEEAIARKVRAREVSDAVGAEATIIKARFVKRPRPSLWQRGKNALNSAVSAAPGVALRALINTPAAVNTITNIMTPAAEKTAEVLSHAPAVAGMAAHAAAPVASTIGSYIPSMSSLLHAANSIKDTIVHTVQRPFIDASVLLPAIKALEEAERQRRIAEDNSGFARVNAKRTAQLIDLASRYAPPTYMLRPNKGFINFIRGIEERERTRRLANKHEFDTRRYNAYRVASLLNQLGWPFIRSAKGGRHCTPMAMLAEDERRRRMADQQGMFTAKYNANKIAGLIKLYNQPRREYIGKITRGLEEKERRHRMKRPDQAPHNAHRVAQLFENSRYYQAPAKHNNEGVEMFKKEYMPESHAVTPLKYNKVKKARPAAHDNKELTKSKHERQLAQEYPVDQLQYAAADTKLLEDTERKSRLADKDLQQLSMANASKVSGIIKKHLAPYKAPKEAKKPTEKPMPVVEFTYTAPMMPTSAPAALYQPPAAPEQVSIAYKPSISFYDSIAFNPSPASLPLQPLKKAPIVPTSAPVAPEQPIFAYKPSISYYDNVAFNPSPASLPLQTLQKTHAAAPATTMPLPQPTAIPTYNTFSTPEATTIPRSAATSQTPLLSTAAPIIQPAAPIVQAAAPTHHRYPTEVLPIVPPAQSSPTFIPVIPKATTTTRSAALPTKKPAVAINQPHTAAIQPLTPARAPLDKKLVQSVQKLYELELQMAENERVKARALAGKGGMFAGHRRIKHEVNFAKHINNAKRHEEWLRASGQPVPVTARTTAALASH